MIEHGADVNTHNINKKNNLTALICASKNNKFEIAKYLVENGADVNARDKYNRTALIIASVMGYLEIREYLVEHGLPFGSLFNFIFFK